MNDLPCPAATVFVVDDDPAVRDSLRTLLECHGLDVQDFASGTDFLDRYRPGGPQHGCLLLDIHMPSFSGFDVLHRLAAGRMTIPTLLMTGKVDPTTRRRARQSSAAGLLEKPLEEGPLLDAIRRVIDGRGGAATDARNGGA